MDAGTLELVDLEANLDFACVTKAESNMSADEFFAHLVADEGMDQADADRFRRALSDAVSEPQSSGPEEP